MQLSASIKTACLNWRIEQKWQEKAKNVKKKKTITSRKRPEHKTHYDTFTALTCCSQKIICQSVSKIAWCQSIQKSTFRKSALRDAPPPNTFAADRKETPFSITRVVKWIQEWGHILQDGVPTNNMTRVYLKLSPRDKNRSPELYKTP